MKMKIESTSKIVTLRVGGQDVPARIWEGHTEAGVPVHAFITRVAVAKEEDASQFEAELQEHRAPSAEVAAAYQGDARLVL